MKRDKYKLSTVKRIANANTKQVIHEWTRVVQGKNLGQSVMKK